MKKQHLIYCTILLLFGCRNATEQRQNSNHSYFDVKGYFETEADRIRKLGPTIKKTVAVDDSTETQSLKIVDWKRELAAFSDADINRASWKGMFKIAKSNGNEIYTSDNEKIPVKQVGIFYKDKKLFRLQMLIENKNTLYTSLDTLNYYPDSLYQIKKVQNIRLLNKKNYVITGRF